MRAEWRQRVRLVVLAMQVCVNEVSGGRTMYRKGREERMTSKEELKKDERVEWKREEGTKREGKGVKSTEQGRIYFG
jgi:hypothetical protein